MGFVARNPDCIAYEQKNGAEYSAHSHSLISAFVYRSLKISIVKVDTCEMGSYNVWEINMTVCPLLEFDDIILRC